MREEIKGLLAKPFFWGALLILVLGALYIATLLPGVGYSGDTAKFQFVGKILGIPHATGFPTYLILNYIFTTLFPIGGLAYKANLLSSLFSVVSIYFLFRILISLDMDNTVAFVTALTFGLTATLWSQSVVAEVYTLNLLFVAIVFYFFLKWYKTKDDRNLLWGCAFYALSFGNHPTTVAFLPAIVYFIWATDKKVFTDIKRIRWVILFIFLGALQYLYFFWRFYDPNTKYVEMVNQTLNLKTLFWYVTGAQFKPRMFSFPIFRIFFERNPMVIELFLKEYYFLILFAIFGLFNLKYRPLNIFFLLSIAGNVFLAINYSSPEEFVYFIPTYFITAIYTGEGLAYIKKAWSPKGYIFSYILIIALPIFLFAANYNKVNQRDNTVMAKKINGILETVDKDAIIISPDYMYSECFWYYLIGEGRGRNNIYIMHHYSTEAVKAYLDKNESFYLPEERKYVPVGLDVYCVSLEHRGLLEKAGLRLTQVREGLYKLIR